MSKNAEMWVNIWYLNTTDATLLNTKIKECLLVSSFSIVGESDHNFYPQGYTKTFLLSESHCALHTWPEVNRTWLELASCNKEKLIQFSSHIKNIFYVSPASQIETKIK